MQENEYGSGGLSRRVSTSPASSRQRRCARHFSRSDGERRNGAHGRGVTRRQGREYACQRWRLGERWACGCTGRDVWRRKVWRAVRASPPFVRASCGGRRKVQRPRRAARQAARRGSCCSWWPQCAAVLVAVFCGAPSPQESGAASSPPSSHHPGGGRRLGEFVSSRLSAPPEPVDVLWGGLRALLT